MCPCHVARKPVLRFSTRSDKNWAVQPQKMDRSLKFWILKADGLYLRNKNIGRLSDLHLCFFSICKKQVFS